MNNTKNNTPPVAPAQAIQPPYIVPNPEVSTQFELTVRLVGNRHRDSEAKMLLFALVQIRTEKTRDLIQAMADGDNVAAGAALAEMDDADHLLTELALNLHTLAYDNAQVVERLEDPDMKSTTMLHEDQTDAYANRIKQIIGDN